MRQAMGIALAGALAFAACGWSNGSDDASKATTTQATPRTEVTTTLPAATTTTVAAPPPDLVNLAAFCAYLTETERAEADMAPLWASIGVPPPAANRGPILNVGWLGGVASDAVDQRDRQTTQVALLLPRLRHVLEANPQVEEVVVVFSGASFDVSTKTIYQPDLSEVLALDSHDLAGATSLAMRTPTAQWTQGRLPFTYVGPNESQLDPRGIFVGGPCV